MNKEFIAKKNEQMNELKSLLEKGVSDVFKSEEYKNWLDTMNNLIANKFSFRNALLLHIQDKNATYALGYEQWKEYGRNVVRGAKALDIFVPQIANEQNKGQFWNMIKGGIFRKMSENPNNDIVYYRVGLSNMYITFSKDNGMYGIVNNNKEVGIFTENQLKEFINKKVLGKIPMYYRIGKVFDVANTTTPEYLWLKKDFKDSELVLNEQGEPIKNRKGEYKVINSTERQAKFKPFLTKAKYEIDEVKMTRLYNVLKSVSENNNVPVYEVERATDKNLRIADGYFCDEVSTKHPNGYIVLPTDLKKEASVRAIIHEIAHSKLHSNKGLETLSTEMKDKGIEVTTNLEEIQAESVGYVVGKKFGLDLGDTSFKYIAQYTNGLENQMLQKSLNIIYNECVNLTKSIDQQLEIMGFTPDLEIIVPTKESSISDKLNFLKNGGSLKEKSVEKAVSKEQTRSKNNQDISR